MVFFAISLTFEASITKIIMCPLSLALTHARQALMAEFGVRDPIQKKIFWLELWFEKGLRVRPQRS